MKFCRQVEAHWVEDSYRNNCLKLNAATLPSAFRTTIVVIPYYFIYTDCNICDLLKINNLLNNVMGLIVIIYLCCFNYNDVGNYLLRRYGKII